MNLHSYTKNTRKLMIFPITGKAPIDVGSIRTSDLKALINPRWYVLFYNLDLS